MRSFPPSKNRLAALEQDKAAGGAELRKMRTKSGGIVTVSLALSPVDGGSRVTLRFKWGGGTIQRTIGTVSAPSRPESLRLAWRMLRENQIVENEGWSWVDPSP